MKRLALFTCLFVTVSGDSPAAEVRGIYDGDRQPAANPVQMHLFPEPGRLRGWIGGIDAVAGEKVTLVDGEQSLTLDLDAEGRFHWEGEAEQVTVRFREEEQVVALPPQTDGPEPIAFFVVDRSVCRPQSSLHFAAFLREPDGQGSLSPVKNAAVEVVLTSKTKGIRAVTLKLTTDEFGRVTGDYAFAKADPRDDYHLKVKGYAGSAEIKLAEFRKAKVRLDISHERPDAETLKLTFRALDFLEKPVPASSLQLDARVLPAADRDPRLWGLNPEHHAQATSEDRAGHWYALSAEEQALSLAGVPVVPNRTATSVHTVSKNLAMDEEGKGEFFLMLDPAWKHGHVLEVSASIIDANEREQRASKRIPLGPEPDPNLRMELDRSELLPGTPVEITTSCPEGQSLSLLAFRLKTRFEWPGDSPPASTNPFLRSDSRLRSRAGGRAIRHRLPPQPVQRIAREYHSISHPEKIEDQEDEDGTRRYRSTLRFGKPGAYVVQALARGPAGGERVVEKTLVVLPEQRASGLYLELDTDRIGAGDPLRGRVHSRFEGARILLALRDGNGTRVLHPLTVTGKDAAEFEIPLPKGLTLGCELTARYSNDNRALHLHRRPFAVEPPAASRLEISSKIPDTVEPGEEVIMEFSVNRKEKTALVVSVYDQSLLGIAPDPGVDGPSLFHADVRVENGAVDSVLRAYLGNISLNHLIKELDEFLEAEAPENRETPDPLANHLRQLKSQLEANYLYDFDLPLILAWQGALVDLERYSEPHPYHRLHHRSYWRLGRLSEEDMDRPILELIRRTSSSYNSRLAFSMAGEKLQFHPVQFLNGGGVRIFGNGLSIDSGRASTFGAGYFGFGGSPGRVTTAPVVRGRARGDAMWTHFGERDFAVGGNAALSVSGQAFHSHLPVDATKKSMTVDVPAGQHAAAAGGPAMTIRRDFSDSAFFDARVQTNAEGKATVKFKLPDSLTNWRVVVTGVADDLAIGRHTASFRTHRPVMVWPMLSQSFTAGDRVKIFALVHNHTQNDEPFTVSASVKNGRLHGEPTREIDVPADSGVPVYFEYEAGDAGFTEILMTARCAAGQDASLKRLPVFPCSAEQVITRSGFARDKISLGIPKGIDLANSRLEITLSPSLAGDMFDSLDYLVSYPHGCVEQTMSRFLPLIKTTQILERHEIEDEELRKRASVFAEAGIKRLLELQKDDGGWGWNGNSATHEMMTPYALLGLVEAEKAGFEIPSEQAVDRGMERLRGFIDGMRSDRQSADRIYCMWVYRHHSDLPDNWWTWLEDVVRRTLSTPRNRSDLLSDYAAALALEMAAKSDRPALGRQLSRLLVYRAKGSDGQAHWTTANFSRWGNDRFEITAAVLKAFAAFDPEHPLVPRILNYFASTKRGNRWNSTKDTAMILYALCDYLSTRQLKTGDGKIETLIALNGDEHRIVNPDWRPRTLTIEGRDLGKNGQVNLEFLEADPSNLYRAVFRYWKKGSEIEAVDEGVSVTRTFELINPDGTVIRHLGSGDTIPRGSLIRSTLQARTAGHSFNYSLAANPKPSGAEFSPAPQSDLASAHVLREEKASGVYWHHESPGGSISNSVAYRAELAGEFLVPPAYVELMYDTATRGHSESFRLIVTDPKQPEIAGR